MRAATGMENEISMDRIHQTQSAEVIPFKASRRPTGNEPSWQEQQKLEYLALCARIELSRKTAEAIWSRMHQISNVEMNAIAEAYYRAADAVCSKGSRTL